MLLLLSFVLCGAEHPFSTSGSNSTGYDGGRNDILMQAQCGVCYPRLHCSQAGLTSPLYQNSVFLSGKLRLDLQYTNEKILGSEVENIWLLPVIKFLGAGRTH